MFLRFQKIALDVSYGFRQYSPLFLIEVFLIKKRVSHDNLQWMFNFVVNVLIDVIALLRDNDFQIQHPRIMTY